MTTIKSIQCPLNPKVGELKPITSILREWLKSPETAVSRWRNDNYTRLKSTDIDALPAIVREKIAEFVQYFRTHGIVSSHLVEMVEEFNGVEYVDSRRTVELKTFGHDGQWNWKVLRHKNTRVSHSPKHYRGTRSNGLAYNRKVRASQETKQYNYEPR